MTDRYARLNHGYEGTEACASLTAKPAACLAGSADSQTAVAYQHLISNVLSFTTSSLIGSLSDEHGRKGTKQTLPEQSIRLSYLRAYPLFMFSHLDQRYCHGHIATDHSRTPPMLRCNEPRLVLCGRWRLGPSRVGFRFALGPLGCGGARVEGGQFRLALRGIFLGTGHRSTVGTAVGTLECVVDEHADGYCWLDCGSRLLSGNAVGGNGPGSAESAASHHGRLDRSAEGTLVAGSAGLGDGHTEPESIVSAPFMLGLFQWYGICCRVRIKVLPLVRQRDIDNASLTRSISDSFCFKVKRS